MTIHEARPEIVRGCTSKSFAGARSLLHLSGWSCLPNMHCTGREADFNRSSRQRRIGGTTSFGGIGFRVDDATHHQGDSRNKFHVSSAGRRCRRKATVLRTRYPWPCPTTAPRPRLGLCGTAECDRVTWCRHGQAARIWRPYLMSFRAALDRCRGTPGLDLPGEPPEK